VAFSEPAGRSDFVVWDEGREALTRVPHSEASAATFGILWTQDGRDLLVDRGLFAQSRLIRRAADGSSPAVDLNVHGFRPTSWSPDGKTLLLESPRPGNDILALTMEGTNQPEPLLATPSGESNGTLSPDGRWLAYMSDESGRYEVYVRPFPDVNNGKWLISTDGGSTPLWTRGGRELVYRSGTKLMSVPVAVGTSFKAGRPEELWDRTYVARTPLRDFDVSADGERFLFFREEGAVAVVLVQNWSEELKAKVP
jgi:serine/threonine-protein kinase